MKLKFSNPTTLQYGESVVLHTPILSPNNQFGIQSLPTVAVSPYLGPDPQQ